MIDFRNLHDPVWRDFMADEVSGTTAEDFWQHVDTRPAPVNAWLPRAESSSWREERGTECLALRGDGERCIKPTHEGPFCDFHWDSASDWFIGLVTRRAFHTGAIRQNLSPDEAERVIYQALRIVEDSNERVYFYELEGQGLVKIGTSNRPEVRTAQFRSGKGCTFPKGVDPTTGHLIGTTPGGRSFERHLHRIYAGCRVAGEWFRLTDELADDIARLIGATQEAAA